MEYYSALDGRPLVVLPMLGVVYFDAAELCFVDIVCLGTVTRAGGGFFIAKQGGGRTAIQIYNAVGDKEMTVTVSTGRRDAFLGATAILQRWMRRTCYRRRRRTVAAFQATRFARALPRDLVQEVAGMCF